MKASKLISKLVDLIDIWGDCDVKVKPTISYGILPSEEIDDISYDIKEERGETILYLDSYMEEMIKYAISAHDSTFRGGIVCLCGSTKFKKEFEDTVLEESLKGKVVLSVCCFTHADNLEFEEDELYLFHDLHRRKIDMADEIVVINPDGYIGETTKKEIELAESLGKKITYKYGDKNG